MIDVSYIRQKEALGLGPRRAARAGSGGPEPFAVVLADDVIEAETPCLRQLLDIYEFFSAPVLAVMEVPKEAISAYGCIDAEPVTHNGKRGPGIPHPRSGGKAEGQRSAVQPRHHRPLHADAGNFRLDLQAIDPGSGGEIQLTDSLRHLLRSRPIYAYKFEGKRYDAGDKLGFLKATVEYALHRHDLGGPFREYLKGLKLSS